MCPVCTEGVRGATVYPVRGDFEAAFARQRPAAAGQAAGVAVLGVDVAAVGATPGLRGRDGDRASPARKFAARPQLSWSGIASSASLCLAAAA